MPDLPTHCALPPDCRDGVVFGIDFGTKRIGLAVGQRISGTAAPLGTIRTGNSGEPWKSISAWVAEWHPALFVVGIAHRPSGDENPIVRSTREFCAHLAKRYRLPVLTVDETLSTAESRRQYRARSQRFRESFEQVKDEWAAQVILQTWLDEPSSQEHAKAETQT